MNEKLKETLEEDIENLFEAVVKARNIDENKNMSCPNPTGLGVKNYSTYRKLIDTVRKMLNTYKKVVNYTYEEKFYSLILSKINDEISLIHELYKESLNVDELDQYRCLVDIYDKLIDLSQEIERLWCYTRTEINDNKR